MFLCKSQIQITKKWNVTNVADSIIFVVLRILALGNTLFLPKLSNILGKIDYLCQNNLFCLSIYHHHHPQKNFPRAGAHTLPGAPPRPARGKPENPTILRIPPSRNLRSPGKSLASLEASMNANDEAHLVCWVCAWTISTAQASVRCVCVTCYFYIEVRHVLPGMIHKNAHGMRSQICVGC